MSHLRDFLRGFKKGMSLLLEMQQWGKQQGRQLLFAFTPDSAWVIKLESGFFF